MIISILIAFLLAKLKKHRVLPVFRSFSLYPLFAVELIYWFFQINTFLGNYTYIQYAAYLKSAYLYVLLLPILFHRLYFPALAGSACILAGTALNKLAIHYNGGRMPMYPTLSRVTGYFNEEVIAAGADRLHSLGDAHTRLKFLTDYIDIGWSVLSVGDVLIHSFITIIVYFTIKAASEKQTS